MKKTVAAVIVAAASSSCASSGPGSGDLVHLYDIARPDGIIEIEIDRDASFREMEAEVPIESVPQDIVMAARAKFPQAQITGAEREFTSSGPGWEVQMREGGRAIELVYDDDADLLEFEQELQRSEAPEPVLRAADTAVTGGRLVSVELAEEGDQQLYHVKHEKDGVRYKTILEASGRIVRRVREHRAEIEIPLDE